MPVISELIRTEQDGSISFGNYKLSKKEKLENFENHGDLYKIKTFCEMTKLERNGMFVYESVPGTAVTHFVAADGGVSFEAEGDQDTQITVQLEDDTEYVIFVDGSCIGEMQTNLSGKLVVSVEMNGEAAKHVKVAKL